METTDEIYHETEYDHLSEEDIAFLEEQKEEELINALQQIEQECE